MDAEVVWISVLRLVGNLQVSAVLNVAKGKGGQFSIFRLSRPSTTSIIVVKCLSSGTELTCFMVAGESTSVVLIP